VKALNEKSDGFITKPFDPPELLEMIRKLIAEKKNAYLQMLTEVENAKENKSSFQVSTSKPMVARLDWAIRVLFRQDFCV
jgi:DNA-binding response OmpR family regulator